MAKQFKFIKDIFPMTKGWTVKVLVTENTMHRESQHSSNRYQRLILIDYEVNIHVYIYIYIYIRHLKSIFCITLIIIFSIW